MRLGGDKMTNQEAIETLSSFKVCGMRAGKDRLAEALEVAVEALKKKQGKWLHENDDHFDWLVCSCCDYGSEGEVGYLSETPYCPMCGAEMSGVID